MAKIYKKQQNSMDSRSKNNSAGISLEEKFANVSSQLSSVTERLGHVEHDLDLERASREDIIKAEVERRLKEMERALEAKYEERENARETDYEERKRKLEQEKKDHEDMCRKKMEKHGGQRGQVIVPNFRYSGT